MESFFDNGIARLYQADARQIPLPDKSVHVVCTSPPYYGLRVYRTDSDAMIGLEETPEQWLAAMLEVMSEVGRVLRDDGVLWVNLGDSYASIGRSARKESPGVGATQAMPRLERQVNWKAGGGSQFTWQLPGGHQAGDLLGIPDAFKNGMKANGWIHRDTVIWAKKSAMPESLAGTRWERCRVKVGSNPTPTPTLRDMPPHGWGERDGNMLGQKLAGRPDLAEYTDCPGCDKCNPNGGYVLRNGSWRCTSAHEYIFQFVKQMGYYCDGEAVKTAGLNPLSWDEYAERTSGPSWPSGGITQNAGANKRDGGRSHPTGANRRSVWSDIKPEPYGGEHYATFPSDLPRLCIQASTSEAGVCGQCGAQWARVVESQIMPTQAYENGNYRAISGWCPGQKETKTLSWRATCTCNADKVPATVLDPFAGTATTCLAAMRLGRRSVGVDLSQDYLHMAVKRLSEQTMPMIG